MKKRVLLVIGLSLFVILIAFKPSVQSRTKVYYSGEAVNYNNSLIFATTNTGALELFALENKKVVRTAMFKPKFVSLPKGSENYHDLEFDIVNGRLYLYLLDGRYLYKYDVSNPYSPRLLEKLKDNSWDWFEQLDRTDDYLVTIGTKDVKFWNRDLQVINSFKIDYDKPENVSVSRDGKFIFNLIDNVLEVYSVDERKITTTLWLNSKEASIKGVYYDVSKGEIFITDDEALKVYNENGVMLRSFKHTSDYGYDVEPSNLSNSIYFSDGIGIVRSDKNTLKALDWKYTTGYTQGNSWTMDIEVVSDPSGDKIVAFNNAEVIVLDDDLELIDQFKSSVKDEAPIEGLNLALDKESGIPGEHVQVSGGGFAPNEELSIKMGEEKWVAKTDTNGRFIRTIDVADIKPQVVDIKVVGIVSGLSYSTTFKIQ